MIEYAAQGGAPARKDPLRSLSLTLFIVSLTGGVLALALLVAGIGSVGAGHGDWTVWYVGLSVWAVSWLVLLISCVSGIASWTRTRRSAWWIVLGLLILAATGALGVWGIQG